MSLASLQPVLRSGSTSSAPLVSVDCTSHHLASSASYSLALSRAHGVAEASFSLQAETGYIMKLSSQLGITMVASKGRGYGEAAFRTYEKYATCPFPRRKNKRCVRMNAEGENAGVSGETSETRVRSTVEQSKRILAMQKELLEQIEERKKLVTELKENLGNQVGKIQAYNVDDTSKRDKSRERLPVALETQIQSTFGEQEISEPTSSANIQESTRRSLGIMWPPNASDKSSTRQQNTVAESKPQSPLPSVQEHSPSSTLTSSSVVSFPAPGIWKRIDKAKESVLAVEDTEESPENELLEEVKKDAAAGTDEEKPPPLAGLNVMNVVIVAAECAPWSKTGGLGDVAGALPKALARRGHRVMVVAPRYGNYLEAWETGVRKTYNVAGQDMTVGYFHGYIDGVDYVFVDNTMFHGFANNIYGGSREDVLKRMILFCKAAVEVPWHVPCGGVCYGDGNLVFIANDWHTALLPVYLQAYYRDHGLMAYTRCVLVIHNMAHQGRGPLSDFQLLGLPDHYLDKFRLHDPIGGEHNNIFMAGLITAHRIVTVSHGYAWECQTQLGGWGLDGVIRKYNWKLRGIVNGIDDEEWNPELDKFLQSDGYTNYSIDTLEIGKGACKAALQKELGLPVRSNVPVLGFIGRLDPQKGVDIIAEAMHWMTGQDLQLVMLGSGRADLENMLRSFEGKHRDKVRGWVGFSVKTSHRITAGADILLMPSRFEPCGLNQLYAMRYGTIPVVHAVGGLRDTVKGFDPYSNTGTGWTFDRPDPSALIHALGNALWTYRDFKESWLGIQKRGMSQDLSWDNAAKQYEEEIVKAKYQW